MLHTTFGGIDTRMLPPSTQSRQVQEALAAGFPGTDVLVGGAGAEQVDLRQSLARRLPWAGLLVALTSILLLFAAFGSVVLGMAVAIVIDATVVRALLVPATMRVLGDANWWAPAPLRRWYERHGFTEERPAPQEAPVRVPAG